MDKLDFNISLMIFALGAGLFLIAPLGLLGKAFTNDLYLMALSLQSIGVVTALVVFFRDEIVNLDL